MQILTKAIVKSLPKIGATSNQDDPMVWVKFFNPTGIGTWYGIEYDPEEGLLFGLAELQCRELGYFSLHELEAFRGRFGLGIERDLYFEPCRLSELQ
jgi:hypothetical protein